jgi:hypothetical protein
LKKNKYIFSLEKPPDVFSHFHLKEKHFSNEASILTFKNFFTEINFLSSEISDSKPQNNNIN